MTPAQRQPLVMTVGETMALLDPTTDGPIREGREYSLRVAGAESNFAIALSRLGIPVKWISRLGNDPLGDVIYQTLAAEGLDLDLVRRTAAPTGLFLKWRVKGHSNVLYYRRGSAASQLEASDIPDAALDDVALVHLTGITMALGDSARETVVDVARRARQRKIPVLFDPNHRSALWDGPEEAARVQRPVLEYTDWYLCGEEEGQLLWGAANVSAVFAALEKAGVCRAVVRVGAEGALVRDTGPVVRVAPDRIEDVLDEVGAGDGFAAGFAYGLLNRWDAQECARAGNILAARALRGTGDWETFPYLDEIQDELTPNREGAER